jgi:hypothetical protein
MIFKTIDWNKLSQMGLIERINREILHPLGLAMARDVNAGISPYAVVAPDGHWEYESNHASLIKPDSEVRRMIEELAVDDDAAKYETRRLQSLPHTCDFTDESVHNPSHCRICGINASGSGQ